ncbi:acetyl-CoA carboxylase, biotin carboxyl carrier protein, partial [Rhodobacteraceae bacterium WD3A24]
MTNNPTDADVAFIKALADILNDSELTEVSVKRSYGEDDYLNVRLAKQTAATQAPAPAAPAPAAAPAAAAER